MKAIADFVFMDRSVGGESKVRLNDVLRIPEFFLNGFGQVDIRKDFDHAGETGVFLFRWGYSRVLPSNENTSLVAWEASLASGKGLFRLRPWSLSAARQITEVSCSWDSLESEDEISDYGRGFC